MVFNPDYPMELYSKAVELIRNTENLIEEVLPDTGLRDRNNIKFPVVAKIVAASSGGNFGPKTFLNNALVPPEKRKKVIAEVFKLYTAKQSTDAVAKSEEFWKEVLSLPV